ncbi:MFS transporter [Streptomyces sp. NBC_01643]|uniref:MFS transporter n=1 Tax=Streptomyces sp. NBC_01643 TaxID=2975906 RepID=UPI00386D8CF8|nr:MFS transporter [Streptomyces sp. NBC_01643]
MLTAVELVVFLDTTALNVALPQIGRDLGLGEAQLGWVTNAYILAFGGFMLVGGRAADLLGPRRVFMAGLTAFTIASAFAGVADSSEVLVAARVLQGVGAAVMVPAQLALLSVTFTEPAARRAAFGVWSAMGAAGAALGTAVAGPLTDGFGWPSIFFINLPVGVIALAFTPRLLPADPKRAAGASGRLDAPGAVTGTAALLVIGYAIVALADADTRSRAWLLLGVGVALLCAFIVIEARSAHPLMPLRLFRVRELSGAAIVNMLVGAAHVPVFALLAVYLQYVQHYSPTRSGLAVFPVAAVSITISRTLIPPALKRIGARNMLAAGLAAQALAMAWLARIPVDVAYVPDVLPAALLLGVGLPAAFVGVTEPAVNAVDAADTGIAAGIVNTAQRIGSGLGVTAILAIAFTASGGASSDDADSFADGVHVGFISTSALAVLGCLLTLFLLRTSRVEGQSSPEASSSTGDQATPTIAGQDAN